MQRVSAITGILKYPSNDTALTVVYLKLLGHYDVRWGKRLEYFSDVHQGRETSFTDLYL